MQPFCRLKIKNGRFECNHCRFAVENWRRKIVPNNFFRSPSRFGSLPGNGTLAVQNVFNLDVPMIMGTVMFSAMVGVGANLVVDILYRWIDARIQAAH